MKNLEFNKTFISKHMLLPVIALIMVLAGMVLPEDVHGAKIPISDCKITLSKTSYDYTGKAITPTVTVKYGSKTLTKGGSYRVSYSNNKKPGTATVTVTAIKSSKYSGNAKVKFTINEKQAVSSNTSKKAASTKNPVDLSDCDIYLSYSTSSYTGKALKPIVTVIYNGKTLTKGGSYNVSYSNNVNPGTAKVTITAIKKSKYKGKQTRNFKIIVPPVSNLKASYDPAKKCINISWNKVNNRKHYKVTAYKDGARVGSVKTTTATSYKISNIKTYGSYVISVATIAGSNKASSDNTTVTLYAGKNPQEITGTTEYFKEIGEPDFKLDAKAKGKLTYSSSNKSVATVSSSGLVSIKAPGTVTITIYAAETDDYSDATKEVFLTIDKLTAPVMDVKSQGYGRLDLSWTGSSGAQGFNISRYDASTKKTTTSSIDKGSTLSTQIWTTKGVNQTLKVQCYAKVGGKTYTSSWSNSKTVASKKTTIGQAAGGNDALGDQTGKEVATANWSYSSNANAYNHWDYCFRFKDPAMAEKAAVTMEQACANNKVGYYNKTKAGSMSFTYELKAVGWDASKITKPCGTACSQMVLTCAQAAGVNQSSKNWAYKNSAGAAAALKSNDYFTTITDSKVLSSDKYLQRGDILIDCSGKAHHSIMVL